MGLPQHTQRKDNKREKMFPGFLFFLFLFSFLLFIFLSLRVPWPSTELETGPAQNPGTMGEKMEYGAWPEMSKKMATEMGKSDRGPFSIFSPIFPGYLRRTGFPFCRWPPHTQFYLFIFPFSLPFLFFRFFLFPLFVFLFSFFFLLLLPVKEGFSPVETK